MYFPLIVCLLFGIAGIWFRVYMYRKAVSGYDRVIAINHMVAPLFFLCILIKMIWIIPAAIRFHLSDILFPVMACNFLFTAILFGIFVYRTITKQDTSFTGDHQDILATAPIYKFCVPLGVLCCYGYEIVIDKLRQGPWATFDLVGRFDLTDMVMYTLGGLLAAILVYQQEKQLCVIIKAQQKTPVTPVTE